MPLMWEQSFISQGVGVSAPRTCEAIAWRVEERMNGSDATTASLLPRIDDLFGQYTTLIENNDPDILAVELKIYHLANVHPEAFRLETDQGHVRSHGDTGSTPGTVHEFPLHCLCRQINRAQLTTIQAVYQAFPEAIKSVNSRGELPIHVACSTFTEGSRSSCSRIRELIQFLSEQYPSSLACVEKFRNHTPLHVVCYYGSYHSSIFTDTVAFLLHSYPHATLCRSTKGHTPLQTYLTCHLHQDSDLDVEVVKLLLEASPGSANLRDNLHLTALDYATVERKHSLSSEVVKLILKHTTNASVRDVWAWKQKKKRLAKAGCHGFSWSVRLQALSHFQPETTCHSDYIALPYHPLHAVLESNLLDACQYAEAIENFRDHLYQVDGVTGRLPLHVALASKKIIVIPVIILLQMMEWEPRAVGIHDSITHLYPFQLAAASMHRPHYEVLTLVFAALRLKPSLLLV